MQNTEGSHLLPSGGCCQEYLHRLANGGYVCKVDTYARWIRMQGGYECKVDTYARWIRMQGGYQCKALYLLAHAAVLELLP